MTNELRATPTPVLQDGGDMTHNPGGVRTFQPQGVHPNSVNGLCGSGNVLTCINPFSDCRYILLIIHNITVGFELCSARWRGYAKELHRIYYWLEVLGDRQCVPGSDAGAIVLIQMFIEIVGQIPVVDSSLGNS